MTSASSKIKRPALRDKIMPHTGTPEVIGSLLANHELTIVTAESCTGGLIAHLITNVPGSSGYFLGGVVSYSNALKRDLLGVPDATLERYGAVSEETALAMAKGARERFGADIAVSVTGIAGPGGGTTAKPVGLTWIGLAKADTAFARQFVWGGDREENKHLSATAALDLIAAHLEQE